MAIPINPDIQFLTFRRFLSNVDRQIFMHWQYDILADRMQILLRKKDSQAFPLVVCDGSTFELLPSIPTIFYLNNGGTTWVHTRLNNQWWNGDLTPVNTADVPKLHRTQLLII